MLVARKINRQFDVEFSGLQIGHICLIDRHHFIMHEPPD